MDDHVKLAMVTVAALFGVALLFGALSPHGVAMISGAFLSLLLSLAGLFALSAGGVAAMEAAKYFRKKNDLLEREGGLGGGELRLGRGELEALVREAVHSATHSSAGGFEEGATPMDQDAPPPAGTSPFHISQQDPDDEWGPPPDAPETKQTRTPVR